MMQRYLISALAVVLALGLVACDSGAPKGGDKAGAAKKADATAKKDGAKKADGAAAKGDAAKKDDAKADAKKDAPKGPATPDGKGGLVVTSELYKLKFTVPEKWKVEKSPTGISVSSPDEGVMMVVAGSKSQDLAEAALNDLKKNIQFKDVKLQKQGTTNINGLIGLRGEGDAILIKMSDKLDPIEDPDAKKEGDAAAKKEGDAAKKEGDAAAKPKEEAIHFVGFSTKVDEKAITVFMASSKDRYEKEMATIEGVLGTLSKL